MYLENVGQRYGVHETYREQIALFLANTFEGQLNDDDVRDPHLDN